MPCLEIQKKRWKKSSSQEKESDEQIEIHKVKLCMKRVCRHDLCLFNLSSFFSVYKSLFFCASSYIYMQGKKRDVRLGGGG